MRAGFCCLALLFAYTASAAEVRAVRFAHGFINAWALVGDRIVLVDSGVPGKAERILKDFKRAKLDPAQVSAIVLTHAHADHAGGAAALRVALGVPIIAGTLDSPQMMSGTEPEFHPTGPTGRLIRPFIPKAYPPLTADVLVTDRLDLKPYGVSAEVQWVGGHTAGSLVVRLPDGRVVSGDLVRGEIAGPHKPHVHFFHDDEFAAEAATDRLLADGVNTFLPGHGNTLDAADVAAWRARKR